MALQHVAIGSGAKNVTLAASNALVDALQKHGYAYLQHPRVTAAALRDLRQTCRRFFTAELPALSDFERESLKTTIGFRGFYRYVGAGGLDDAIDCFSIGRDDVTDPSELRRAYYVRAGWEASEFLPHISRRNAWPPRSPELRAALTNYYDACHDVSMDVLRHVSCALGIRPSDDRNGGALEGTEVDLEHFVRCHAKRDCNLEAKFYPRIGSVARRSIVEVKGASVAQPQGPRVLRRKDAVASPLIVPPTTADAAAAAAAAKPMLVRLASHKDLSTVTLLAQDALGGLEVFDDAADAFVSVPVLEDALLVNAGTFLERWTGGLIEATPHRVRCVGDADRCSIVFFCFPDFDAKIEPLMQATDTILDVVEPFDAGDMMPSY